MKSDLYDVLACIAFLTAPVTREETAEASKNILFTEYVGNEQVFLEFVLAEYVKEGVGELDEAKLLALLELKYSGLPEAVAQLGGPGELRGVFVGFQKHLYEMSVAG